MENATAKQMADQLRKLATELEQFGDDITCGVSLRFYSNTDCQVTRLEHLRTVSQLMTRVKSHRYKRYQWIKGHFGQIKVTAHYTHGLLGAKRKVRVIERDAEVSADLSLPRP